MLSVNPRIRLGINLRAAVGALPSGCNPARYEGWNSTECPLSSLVIIVSNPFLCVFTWEPNFRNSDPTYCRKNAPSLPVFPSQLGSGLFSSSGSFFSLRHISSCVIAAWYFSWVAEICSSQLHVVTSACWLWGEKKTLQIFQECPLTKVNEVEKQ